MLIFYNTATNEYPLFIGDILLINESWTSGMSLPENIVSVEETTPISAGENQMAYEVLPVLSDGVWKQNFAVRDLSEDEINNTTRFRYEFFRNWTIS